MAFREHHFTVLVGHHANRRDQRLERLERQIAGVGGGRGARDLAAYQVFGLFLGAVQVNFLRGCLPASRRN